MKIFIYGDSNTWGYMPNLKTYSRDCGASQYPEEKMWWYPLKDGNEVIVNGLPGRSISEESPYMTGRKALNSIEDDLKGLSDVDLVIVQLGTNDCKSRYGLSAEDITSNLEKLLKKIEKRCSNIMIISPACLPKGNVITDKHYIGGDVKTKELERCYMYLAKEYEYFFVSGFQAETGIDGEHLSEKGHEYLAKEVMKEFQIFLEDYYENI